MGRLRGRVRCDPENDTEAEMTDMQEQWWAALRECDGPKMREIVRGGRFQSGWRIGGRGDTPLTHAVKEGNHEAVEIVCEAAGLPVEKPADIWRKAVLDARNMDVMCGLHIAVREDFEHAEGMIQAMLDAGADQSVLDSDGNDVPGAADSIGNMGAIELLAFAGLRTEEE